MQETEVSLARETVGDLGIAVLQTRDAAQDQHGEVRPGRLRNGGITGEFGFSITAQVCGSFGVAM